MERTDKVLDNIDITEDEIYDIIVNLDPNTASGPDLISNKMIKNVAGAIAKALRIIFNRSLREGIFPDIWKLGNLVPLYKKGDRSISANYRQVTLVKFKSALFLSICITICLVIIFYSHISLVFDLVIPPLFNSLIFFTISANLLMRSNILAWCFATFQWPLIRFSIRDFYLNFDKMGSRATFWHGFLIICHQRLHYSLLMLVFPRGLYWGHFSS